MPSFTISFDEEKPQLWSSSKRISFEGKLLINVENLHRKLTIYKITSTWKPVYSTGETATMQR
jgi:hypothetical protein